MNLFVKNAPLQMYVELKYEVYSVYIYEHLNVRIGFLVIVVDV